MKNDLGHKELGSNSTFFAPGETLLIAKRKHWMVLFSPLASTAVASITLIMGALLLSFYVFETLTVFVVLTFLVFSVSTSLILKTFIDWYFHLYMVTTRKVLEVQFSPFFSEIVNDVLLTRVRCTEVDVQTNGMVNQMLRKGDVTLTFDRPTHTEGFVFKDIHHPRKVGYFLSELLTRETEEQQENHTWIKAANGKQEYTFVEDILPKEVRVT